jgi:hypothetical protein
MTSGSFRMNLPTLSHEMKGTDVGLMAALRPVIGLGVRAGHHRPRDGRGDPVDKQSGATQTALFAGIGFLAGFSERLAQNMFVRSGQGLTGVMAESPAPARRRGSRHRRAPRSTWGDHAVVASKCSNDVRPCHVPIRRGPEPPPGTAAT